MPEAKNRKKAPRVKSGPRVKTENPQDEIEEDNHVMEAHMEEPLAPPAPPEEEFSGGFDAETNNRYEEIKRGGTHLTQLPHMTIPQLLKTGQEKGLNEYTGLKKQD